MNPFFKNTINNILLITHTHILLKIIFSSLQKLQFLLLYVLRIYLYFLQKYKDCESNKKKSRKSL